LEAMMDLAAALALALTAGSPQAAGVTVPVATASEAAIPQPPVQQPAADPAPSPEDKPVVPPQPNPLPAPVSDDTIIVTGRERDPPGDPVQQVNLKTFEVATAFDEAVAGPIAKGYQRALPRPARTGLRNVLANLTEPIVFVNYLLQLKPGKAAETLGRFTINSTLGLGGLVDVAKDKPFNLPYRPNGFGQTLGYYGVKPGPYLYLPLIGPTTVRDLTGRLLDLSLVPAAAGAPFNSPYYALGTGTLRTLDERIAMDERLRLLRYECSDPYTATRQFYLAERTAQIEALHGRSYDLAANLPACLAPVVPAPAAPETAVEPAPVVPPAPAEPVPIAPPEPVPAQPADTPTM
jgi:phospholipid-binding lipoprotein MlaA